MKSRTEQEDFWSGIFGNNYINRNNTETITAANIALFAKILEGRKIFSTMEYGANIGLNLDAIKTLFPNVERSAVEINREAFQVLEHKGIKAYHDSILNFKNIHTYDLVFCKGVLIHINPDYLPQVYKLLYESSNKYILIAEYYNPSPVAIPYRGHDNKLFKRDFAGEFLTQFSDTRLVDYGFVYHKDLAFPQDDITWFLIEK